MMDKQSSVWVVIPAAGVGQRMQSEHPKQYLKILNKTIIEYTLDCFIRHTQIAGIVVVLSSDDEYWRFLDINSKSKPLFTSEITVNDYSSRSDSVMQGLKYLRDEQNVPDDAWVMVHDAARPCVSKTDIDALLNIRDIESIGGILASPVRDTMKRSQHKDNDNERDGSVMISSTESRENLWHALTPQMFRLGELSEAFDYCQKQNIAVTDESSAMENRGYSPILVEGSHNNIKVTYPSDIELASLLIGKNL